MKRVTHIINGLGVGGAEMMLYKLLTREDPSKFRSDVIALGQKGPIADRISSLGVAVHVLNINPCFPSLFAAIKLYIRLRRDRPDIVQTWMQHSDLVGGVIARLARVRHVVWNIRHGTMHKGHIKRRTIAITRACAALSGIIPQKIVCCSNESRRAQVELGYSDRRMLVIPNGFDTEKFRPDAELRMKMRRELGVSANESLMGIAGRLHPQKDFKTFIEAASIVVRQNSNVHFAMCGAGVSRSTPSLRLMLDTILPEQRKRFHLLGPRDDMPAFMSSLDLYISSSSFGEGFPNVLGEAMSCGVPCVATNVGDAAEIIGCTGKVVPPSDPSALADACKSILNMPAECRRTLGDSARQRILDHFSLPKIAAKYAALYDSLSVSESSGKS